MKSTKETSAQVFDKIKEVCPENVYLEAMKRKNLEDDDDKLSEGESYHNSDEDIEAEQNAPPS